MQKNEERNQEEKRFDEILKSCLDNYLDRDKMVVNATNGGGS